MSKIYSFRLDENNPREAQAREVIEAWVSKGYSLRYVITEALLLVDNAEGNENGLPSIIEQLKELLSVLEENRPVNKTFSSDLPKSFVDSIKTSIKSGHSVTR